MTLLAVHDLAFAYSTTPIFQKVNFTLQAGKVLTILGPNGAGKSTLLQCLTGLLTPDQGTVMIGDRQLDQLSPRQVAQQIAYVPQDYHINSNLTVIDYLLTGRTPYLATFQMPRHHDELQAQKYLKTFGLSSLRNRPFTALSGGQQQLLAIIRALLQQPQVLILDEPMAALDLSRQYELLQLIKKLAHQQIAIILTTHLPDHALMLPTTIGLLSPAGTFTVGTRQQLMTNEQLTALYQVPLELTYLPQLHRYTCQLKL